MGSSFATRQVRQIARVLTLFVGYGSCWAAGGHAWHGKSHSTHLLRCFGVPCFTIRGLHAVAKSVTVCPLAERGTHWRMLLNAAWHSCTEIQSPPNTQPWYVGIGLGWGLTVDQPFTGFGSQNARLALTTQIWTHTCSCSPQAAARRSPRRGRAYDRPGLSEEEIEEIREAFNLFDTDGSGTVMRGPSLAHFGTTQESLAPVSAPLNSKTSRLLMERWCNSSGFVQARSIPRSSSRPCRVWDLRPRTQRSTR